MNTQETVDLAKKPEEITKEKKMVESVESRPVDQKWRSMKNNIVSTS